MADKLSSPTRDLTPRTRNLLIALLVVHVLLSSLYALTMPVFEKLDERSHWYYVHYVRENWNVPDQRTVRPPRLQWYQPPLYYFIAAGLTGPIPSTEYLDPPVNPFYLRFPLTSIPDNMNLWLHDPAIDGWPWHGDPLAIRLLRFLSIVFSSIAIYFGFRVAHLLFDDDWLALGATAWLAFMPGTMNICTSVANDPLSFATGTAVLFISSWGLVRGFNGRASAILGVVAGLALLSKVTTAATVAMIPLAFLLSPSWRDDRRKAIGQFALVVGLAVLISGWWFARNLILYGELTGSYYGAQQYGIVIAEPEPFNWGNFQNQIFIWFFRYWAHFGAMGMPRWTNTGLVIMAVLLGVGFVMALARKTIPHMTSQRRLLIFLFAALALNIAELYYLGKGQMHGSQPRWLFSIYPVTTIMIQIGVVGWVGVKRPRLATLIPVVIMVPLAFYGALGVVWPAYRMPHRVDDPARLAERYQEPANVPIGDTIRLVGFGIEPRIVRPGDVTYVTLCFESGGPTEVAYPYFVHLVDVTDESNRKVGERETHPGLGSYQTSIWEPGVAFCDRVRVPIESYAGEEAPRTYVVYMGFFDLDTLEPLMGSVLGQPEPKIPLGEIAIIPREWPAVEESVDGYRFGEVVRLADYTFSVDVLAPGDSLSVDVTWQRLDEMSTDYTVFVHLIDSGGKLVAQADSWPRGGLFPTSLWPENAVVQDSFTLAVPPDAASGTYHVWIGWYDAVTGERLSIVDDAGNPVPDGVVELGTVEIQ